MMDRPTVFAPAKLTKSLRITGVRDDGMHTIDAEMVTLDLFDELELEAGGAGVRFVESGYDVKFDPVDNLITRAAELAGVVIRASVLKRIPAGAGLGGGSADAAAVLRWAGFSDVERAASIGADVAFCLVGGRARVRGVGELIEPLPFQAQTFTVVTPPIHCSTPAVYAKWDDMGGPMGDNGNDLEPAALAVEPALARARAMLGDASGETPRLAGSGSSWFVVGAFPESGRVLHTLPADFDTREV
jgi:4-diphosphocytidyl-2-C-methyl-D-erythritol kinase